MGAVRYTPRFERRHRLDVALTRKLGGAGSSFTSRVVLASGQPYTPVLAIIQPFGYDPTRDAFTTDGRPSFVLGAHNSARLPSYLRIDLAARKGFTTRRFGRDMRISVFGQVMNVLNTKNVLTAEPDAFGGNGRELKYLPQMPLLPSVGVEWTF